MSDLPDKLGQASDKLQHVLNSLSDEDLEKISKDRKVEAALKLIAAAEAESLRQILARTSGGSDELRRHVFAPRSDDEMTEALRGLVYLKDQLPRVIELTRRELLRRLLHGR